MESYGLLTAKGGVTKVYPDLDLEDADKQKRTIRIEYCVAAVIVTALVTALGCIILYSTVISASTAGQTIPESSPAPYLVTELTKKNTEIDGLTHQLQAQSRAKSNEGSSEGEWTQIKNSFATMSLSFKTKFQPVPPSDWTLDKWKDTDLLVNSVNLQEACGKLAPFGFHISSITPLTAHQAAAPDIKHEVKFQIDHAPVYDVVQALKKAQGLNVEIKRIVWEPMHVQAPGPEVRLIAIQKLRETLGQPPTTHRAAWLHVPKAGTSFGVTVTHWSNFSLPDRAVFLPTDVHQGPAFTRRWPVQTWFRDPYSPPIHTKALSLSNPGMIRAQFGPATQSGSLLWMKEGNFAGHHAIPPEIYKAFKGNFFGMFREPGSWAASVWNFFGHEGLSKKDFRAQVAGTQTMMLSGQKFGLNCIWNHYDDARNPRQPCDESLVPDVQLALERLNGFAFVGLTTQWHTSICLFHLKFGSPCHGYEFKDSRPTATDNKPGLVHTLPDDPHKTDPDHIIYERVKELFEAEVMKYGATDERCKQFCP